MSFSNLFKFENLITFAFWLFIATGLAYVCNSIGNTQLPQAYQTLCLVGMYPASIASAALVRILVNFFLHQGQLNALSQINSPNLNPRTSGRSWGQPSYFN